MIGTMSKPRSSVYTPKTDGTEALYIPFWHPSYATNPATYISKDRARTSWARTGGVWGKYGWTADGDDRLTYTVANWRSSDSAGSILIWFKCTDVTTYRSIFTSSDTATASSYLFIFQIEQTTGKLQIYQTNNDTADFITATTNVADGVWRLVSLTSSGTAWTVRLNGVVDALNVTGGANSGDWFADTPNRDSVVIGARTTTSTTFPFVGTIGEVYYTPEIYTVADDIRYMQRTQWRYKS